MKCIMCETDIILQSSDDEPRRISEEPVCEECYFRSLGEAIEKHPIGIRQYKDNSTKIKMEPKMNERRCENGCGYYDFIRFFDPFEAQIGACKRTGEKKALETKVFENVKVDGCEHYFTLPYPHCKGECRFIKDSKCNYREMHVPTIAVDFDKVLFTHESWQGHYHYGEPLPGAKEALTEFQRMGFKIMIWTTRDQKDIIKMACLRYDIPFDYINENPNQPPEINPSKPVADYYIDDRAVHFRSWDQALYEIKAREVHDQYYPTKGDSK